MTESPAPLTGRRTRLRSVSARDYEWLYGLAMSEHVSYRWRYRGATPSPEAFVQQLWAEAHSQFIIEDLRLGRPLGLAQSYSPNFANGWARLALLLDPEVHHLGWPLEGALLFMRYQFVHWPLRKLYIEGPGVTVDQLVNNVGELFVEEGRLRAHEYLVGEYVDWVTVAIYRETFESEWEQKLGWLVGQNPAPPGLNGDGPALITVNPNGIGT